jgi:Mrp family chromosome partitioning ATPase
METTRLMDAADHFRTIWSKRVFVLVGALAAAAAVFVWRTNEPPTFEAQTTLEVAPARSRQEQRPTGDDAVFIAQSYADRASTGSILDDAGTRSGLGLSRDEIEDRIAVEADPASGLITITASGPSNEDAAMLAESLASSLVATVAAEQQAAADAVLEPLRAEIAELETTLAGLPADDFSRDALEARYAALVAAELDQELWTDHALTVISPADVASDPVSPRPRRDALLAFLVATIVSAELVVAASALGDRFPRRNMRGEVTATSGLPVLTTVPSSSAASARESYGELRTNIALMAPADSAESSSVAVVGAHAGVGCTSTAIGLARAAALGSRAVLLVDGDLRRPAIHERLELPLAPGLAEMLLGADLTGNQPADGTRPSFYVLTAGEQLADPGVALTQHLRERVLEPASERIGLTVIDTPPVGSLSDAAAIAAHCDTTILVMDARATSRRALREVLTRLHQVGVVPLGIVVTGSPRLRHIAGSWRTRRRTRPGTATGARPVPLVVRPRPLGASGLNQPPSINGARPATWRAPERA